MRSEERIQGSHTLSRYGDRAQRELCLDLTLGITRGALQAPGGLHRFEPVCWTESLPSGAMLLTRQGISLSLLPLRPEPERAGHFCRPPHVAMGYGLYLHPRSIAGCPACSL
jgi:hypothetical protein